MSGRKVASLAALLSALVMAGPASAATVHNESADGDFSNDRTAPTAVSFVSGQNDIFGETGNTAGTADRDYFTFVVPAGFTLHSLTVLDSQLVAGGAAFIGLQSGGQVTVDPLAPVPGPLLGYFHFAPDDTDDDILPAMGIAAGAMGFTPPLGSGTFSVWIQDGHPAPSIYGLRFDIRAIPGPGTALLTLTGLASLVGVGVSRSVAARRQPSPRAPRAPQPEPPLA